MFEILTKLYDSLSDSTKRFEDRVLYASQLIGQCHSQWFLDLSRALQPLLVNGDIGKTFELYSSFIYDQAKYQLPVSQAISIVHEAEKRMTDKQTRCAMARVRLITFLVFRWLDYGSPFYGKMTCAYCCTPEKYKFGGDIRGMWVLLKEGNSFIVKKGLPLDEFLMNDGKIILPNGPKVSIDEIRSFLTKQMNAINSLLMEAARDIGIVYARSDYLRGIDLSQSKNLPITLKQLEKDDESGSQIYKLIEQAEATWKVGLLTEHQEELTLGLNRTLLKSTNS